MQLAGKSGVETGWVRAATSSQTRGEGSGSGGRRGRWWTLQGPAGRGRDGGGQGGQGRRALRSVLGHLLSSASAVSLLRPPTAPPTAWEPLPSSFPPTRPHRPRRWLGVTPAPLPSRGHLHPQAGCGPRRTRPPAPRPLPPAPVKPAGRSPVPRRPQGLCAPPAGEMAGQTRLLKDCDPAEQQMTGHSRGTGAGAGRIRWERALIRGCFYASGRL